MIKEYLGCRYEEFPHAKAMRDGIQVLQVNSDMASCNTLCNVVYRVVDGKELHLHILLPTQEKECKKRFPCIVYVQGSGWRIQSCGKELAQLARFAAKGYVVAIVQYRHSEWAAFPAQIMDTKYAIHYMMQHCEDYLVNPNQLILWGDSSGGHTALMSAFTKGEAGFTAEDCKEYNVSCVIDFYGPTDISAMNEVPSIQDHTRADSPEGMLIGGKPVTKENAEATIVMRYITEEKRIPPLLILHGSKDRLVPFAQSVLLYDQMKVCHKEVACYQLYGADHGGEPFWSKEVLDIVDSFIQSKI